MTNEDKFKWLRDLIDAGEVRIPSSCRRSERPVQDLLLSFPQDKNTKPVLRVFTSKERKTGDNFFLSSSFVGVDFARGRDHGVEMILEQDEDGGFRMVCRRDT